MGDEVELRDALTNLVFNAVDAMPEGGTLTLRTRPVVDGDGRATVRIEVGDSGVGMDEDTRRRCIEPFFTTKGERGTGLGLASVYGMLQRHSAALEVDSVPGKGTTMRMIFPAFAEDAATPRSQLAAHVSLRKLRILVIDDDPILIRSLLDVLEADGHRLETALGGAGGHRGVRRRARHRPRVRRGDHRPRHAARRRPQGGGGHQAVCRRRRPSSC